MHENGNHPEVKVAESRSRGRGSGPILFLAVLFVAATFLAWYFTWFGRELSDSDISKYLTDEKNPRHMQHALLQIQQRIERGDQSARNWYPQLISLSGSAETEFRLTVAWLMGFDNKSKEFHTQLQQLLHDPEPIVRRNAALALVRFADSSGREELVAVLRPYGVQATADGMIGSSLRVGSQVTRGTLLARIQQPDGNIAELRSPLPGKINKLMKTNEAKVTKGEEVLSLNSDEQSVWESLRGLSIVGQPEDLEILQSYIASSEASPRIKEQANLTAKAIQSRSASQSKTN
jgi:HEAT repeat protein